MPLLTLVEPADETVTQELTFLHAPPLWVTVLIVVPLFVLVIGALYRFESDSATRRAKVFLATLRLLVLGTLLVVGFQPVSESKVFAVNKSVVGVLVDESLSMDRCEEYDGELAGALAQAAGLPDPAQVSATARAELVQRVLKHDGADLMADLATRVEPRLYAFAASARPLASAEDALQGDDAARGATAIGDSLLTVLSELRHKSLAALVVVTDGQSNQGKDPVEIAALAAADGIPIHAVAVGNPAEPRNLAILAANAPDVAMVDETVPVEVSVAVRGYQGEPAEIILSDRTSGTELARHDFTLSTRGSQQTETVFFKPAREGDYLLEAKIPPRPGEQFADDNVRTTPLRVQPEVIKVLYVEGRPRWQYRYLKGVLLRAKNVRAQCLLTSASADFIQESTEGVPALTRYPPTRKDLFQYDVVILGDLAPDEIDKANSRGTVNDLLAEVREFVTLGGGFIMVAGQLHSPRDYRDTPIADILPVEIGDPEEEKADVEDKDVFRPHLPDWELPHRIVTLETEVRRNRELFEDPDRGLPGMWWYQPVRRAKPGAEVILVHPKNHNRFGPHVLVAATRVPSGRTLFVGVDETWRWRMPYEDRYTERFWRAAIRDVAIAKLRSSDKRFDLRTDQERYRLGDPIELQVRVFDEDFRASRDETQVVHVQRPERAADRAAADRGSSLEEIVAHRQEEGVYQRTLRADGTGTWRFWLEDPAQQGKHLSERAVEVEVPALESLNPSLDRPRLESMAAATGGRCVGLHELAGLLRGISGDARRVPVRTERRDLWDRPELLFTIVGLLALEWALRKKWNLL